MVDSTELPLRHARTPRLLVQLGGLQRTDDQQFVGEISSRSNALSSELPLRLVADAQRNG
jgi:hypothetical protein